MEYVLLEESNRNILSRQVNGKLKEGWKLFGPPSGFVNPFGSGKITYLQALTRDDS